MDFHLALIVQDFTFATIESVVKFQAKQPDFGCWKMVGQAGQPDWFSYNLEIVESGTHSNNHIGFLDIVD